MILGAAVLSRISFVAEMSETPAIVYQPITTDEDSVVQTHGRSSSLDYTATGVRNHSF